MESFLSVVIGSASSMEWPTLGHVQRRCRAHVRGQRRCCSRGRGARADGARRGEDLVVVPADKGLVACRDAEDGSATVPRRFRDGSRKCLVAEEVDLVKVGVREVLQAEGLVPAGREDVE